MTKSASAADIWRLVRQVHCSQRLKNSPDHMKPKQPCQFQSQNTAVCLTSEVSGQGRKLPSLLGCRAPAISFILPQHLSAGCHNTSPWDALYQGGYLPWPTYRSTSSYTLQEPGPRAVAGPVQAEAGVGRGGAVGDTAPAPTCQAGRTFLDVVQVDSVPIFQLPFSTPGPEKT